MKRTLAYFLAVCGLGWLALALAGFVLQREYGLICAAAAGVICFAPTLGSLILAVWSTGKSHSEQLMAVTVGMMLRMCFVLGASLVVFMAVPFFRSVDGATGKSRELTFWGFVLVSYLGTLAVETVLASRGRDNAASPVHGMGG